MDTLVLTYDLGTTGCKTCLYRIGNGLTLLSSSMADYPLYMTADGGAEQSVSDWWNALATTTRQTLSAASVSPKDIGGLSFCCQMQGSVFVDEAGESLRNPMIYMDGRAVKQMKEHLGHGLIKISGMNAFKALKTLWITGGVAATPKDPLWKYHWVRENEPDVFKKLHTWMDVKDYLIYRCTGVCGMTQDSAHVTFIYDTRPGKEGWSKSLCRMFDVDLAHLPKVIKATDVAGTLTEKAAADLGLAPGIPVFGGGGDVSMAAIGSGALHPFDTHIYVGTSGWVVSNVDKRLLDIDNFMASILGAIPGRYNYVGEQETSGACLQWVRDHLALDEIGVYLKDTLIDKSNLSEQLQGLYALLNQAIEQTAPGAGNLIFTPWLHGNRAPREDAHARGMFFNIGMTTGKRQMVRAVVEGVAFHKRWILEAMERKIPRNNHVCFVGGGARSKVWCQIMADVLNREVRTVTWPQDIGTAGAAVVCAVGLGLLKNFEDAKPLIPMAETFYPRPETRSVYDRNFKAFTSLYKNNKDLFRDLNGRGSNS